MDTGLRLILSAASGAGKTTLARALLAWLGEQGLQSVSYTTRPRRGREEEGVDYHFVGREDFERMRERGEFLEWALVHGNLYGSHARYGDRARQGKVVLFVIDVQGGEQIKARHPDAVSVFVLPPSPAELERRLRGRGTDSEEVIGRRLAIARAESERGCQGYDYLVVNDQVERALEKLKCIVEAERSRRGRVDLGGVWSR